MTVSRRSILATSIGLSAAAAGSLSATERKAQPESGHQTANGSDTGLIPGSPDDQTAILQSMIDHASSNGVPVLLPPGRFRLSDLRLRPGTRLRGAGRSTVLEFAGGDAFITGDKADAASIEDLTLDGQFKDFSDERGEGLLTLSRCTNVNIQNIEIHSSIRSGISLTEVAGRVSGSMIHDVLDAAIKSLDARGLEISFCQINSVGNNGILIWRSEVGEDASNVHGNRISKIRNAAGGSGEYGNGINVFRAGSVHVSSNRISDCTYTAIRGNAASNIQIIGNSCERLGEVAIYAEFGFQGALIANNLIDTAAAGISVTNFNDGGRLAVIQGNLIRNLFRREQEVEDKRGEGIGVEADAVVAGNTIEGAPTVGIQVGWGRFLRDVAVTGNVVRQSKVGISISSMVGTGACLIANNLISSSHDGAIRAMVHGVVFGPDLAREPEKAVGMTLNGNVSA